MLNWYAWNTAVLRGACCGVERHGNSSAHVSVTGSQAVLRARRLGCVARRGRDRAPRNSRHDRRDRRGAGHDRGPTRRGRRQSSRRASRRGAHRGRWGRQPRCCRSGRRGCRQGVRQGSRGGDAAPLLRRHRRGGRQGFASVQAPRGSRRGVRHARDRNCNTVRTSRRAVRAGTRRRTHPQHARPTRRSVHTVPSDDRRALLTEQEDSAHQPQRGPCSPRRSTHRNPPGRRAVREPRALVTEPSSAHRPTRRRRHLRDRGSSRTRRHARRVRSVVRCSGRRWNTNHLRQGRVHTIR